MESRFLRITLLALALVVVAQGYDKEALAGWSMGVDPESVEYAVNCGSTD